MDEDGYRSITNIEDIMGYLDSVDGFRDCAAGNVTYDDNSGVLSVEIEEVLEGEDWPRESSGRIWYMNFADIRSMRLFIDVPLGFWISDVYANDDGSVTIESDQGAITVLSGTIELVVPKADATEEGGGSLLPNKSENAPLNMKNIFNDIKNVVNQKRAQLAPESSDPVAVSSSEDAAAVPVATPQATNPFANATPTAAPMPVVPTPTAPTPTPAAPTLMPATPQSSNPFLNDPSFVRMQPTTPTPPPKAPEPPMNGPVFG